MYNSFNYPIFAFAWNFRNEEFLKITNNTSILLFLHTHFTVQVNRVESFIMAVRA